MSDPCARLTDPRSAAREGEASGRVGEPDPFGEVGARSPDPSTPYWCPTCEAWGTGRACWSCNSPNVVRDGPQVDGHVYDPFA